MTQAVFVNDGLMVAAAQYSSAGLKDVNEDALGIRLPPEPLRSRKGVAMVVADGVSAAQGGRQAAEASVQSFLSDFYSTPDSWSVKTSGERVLSALNRWLYGQGQQYINAHQGFLTTFTALVLRSRTAHIFHVGDTRLYRLRDGELELLTKDHAMRVNAQTTYLTRALGMDWYVEIDYGATDIRAGDLFFSASDGVHGFVPRALLSDILQDHTRTLEQRCQHLVELALEQGSDDNLSAQLLEVQQLGRGDADDSRLAAVQLPMPPDLSPGQVLDGYEVEAELHASPRSHLYRVRDQATGQVYALKAPSRFFEQDLEYRSHFAVEEWIGSRIDSPHVVKVYTPERARQCLYYIQEYLEGETLRAWRERNPDPDIKTVVGFAGQIMKGLRALHRREALHQDIKPDNLFLCKDGTIKLIDLGSAFVANLHEGATPAQPGAREYAAPEYALNQKPDTRAEQFSLAATIYELLTGQLPYGQTYAQAISQQDFQRLRYTSACRHNPHVPLWLDAALKKALAIHPDLRYEALGELLDDLQRPNPRHASTPQPWLERNPLRFWQALAAVLALGNIVLLVLLFS